MTDKPTKADFYSGIPWVYVTQQQAHAHPKGKLGAVLWLIVAYFIAIAGLKFYLSISVGAGIGFAILTGLWPLLTGLGLALRVPWAIIMAVVSAGLTVYALLRGFSGDGSVITLFETIASIGILFYLIDGDRPNLVYRHRYRKYSVLRGHEDA